MQTATVSFRIIGHGRFFSLISGALIMSAINKPAFKSPTGNNHDTPCIYPSCKPFPLRAQ
jgi:hypothetical protein